MPDPQEIQAQTPDGVIHSFPAGTPDEVVDRTVKLHLGLTTGAGMMKPAPAPKLPEQPQQIFDMTQSPLATASKDIGAGNYAKGTHTILSSLGKAAAPFALPAAVAAGPVATLGGLAGSMALGYGGKFGGEAMGLTPDQSDVAGDIGGIVGGVAGGMAPRLNNSLASLMRNPATATQAAMGRPGTVKPSLRSPIPFIPKALQPNIPEWMIPKGDLGTPANPGEFSKLPARMPKASAPVDELAQAIKGGIASKIPTRMPKPLAVTPELGSPENPGWVAPLPVKMPKVQAPLGSVDNPGWVAPLPNKMPATTAELGSPENPGLMSRMPLRMPKLAVNPSGGFRGSIIASADMPEPQAAIPRIGAPTPAQELATRQAETPVTSSKIALPDSPTPDFKATLVNYGRSDLVKMIRDPNTPYANRVVAIRELRRNPGEISKEVVDDLTRYMVEPGAKIKIYGGPKK